MNYTARWWTQGETPSATAAAWETDVSNGLQAWNTTRAYNAGNQATYNGKLYEAKWWTQGEAPGQEWGAWLLKGDAPPPNVDLSGLPGIYKATISKTQGVITVSLDGTRGTTTTETVTSGCGISSSTVPFGPTSFASKWKIHLDGVPVLSGDMPPPYPRNPPSVVRPPQLIPQQPCAYAPGTVYWSSSIPTAGQDTTISLPEGSSGFISVWVCNGADNCRPTPLLYHDVWEAGTIVPTFVPAP